LPSDDVIENGGVVPKKRWSDLSERTRRLVVWGAVFEGVLKILALVDLKRRPATEINGSKKKWAAAIALVNSVGLVPVLYFRFGRRIDGHR
jgi:hypothetical protein